jgi:predicted nucleic acid-binding Zn ribbon protein
MLQKIQKCAHCGKEYEVLRAFDDGRMNIFVAQKCCSVKCFKAWKKANPVEASKGLSGFYRG